MKFFSSILLSLSLLLFISCDSGGGVSSNTNSDSTTVNKTQKLSPINNAELSKEYASDDINISTSTFVSIDNGKLFVNSNEVNGQSTSVSAGDYINVKATSSSDFNTAVRVNISIGSTQLVFIMTTLADTTPDSFTLKDIVDASPNQVYTSNTVTISGLSVNQQSPVSLTNGTLILNGVEQVERNTTILNGETLAVSLMSANGYGALKEAVVSIGAFSDSFSVATQPVVESITLSPSSLPLLFVGESKQLLPIISPTNAVSAISFSSSSRSIATVTNDGLVTALHPGQVDITASSDIDNSKSARLQVNVEAQAPEENTTKVFHDGRTWIFNEPDWYKSAFESTLLQVSAGLGNSGEPANPIVQSTGVAYTQSTLMPISYRFAGESKKFDIFLFDVNEGDNYQIDLRTSSGDPYLVLIHGDDNKLSGIGKDIFLDDDSGTANSSRITAYNLPAGRHIVLATVDERASSQSYTGNLILTRIAQQKVTSILLSPVSLVLHTGESRLLSAFVTPTGTNQDIVWSSSDPSIAAVDSEGNLTAYSSGTAVISAISENNNSVLGSSSVFVDISSLINKIGTYDTSGSAIDTALNSSDSVAYVADSAGGLKMVNVDTTSSSFTTKISELAIDGFSEQIIINRDDNVSYIASGDGGVKSVRVTSTGATLLDTYDTNYSLSDKYAWSTTLSSDESELYVSNAKGLDVLNVQNSGNVTLHSSINLSGDTSYDFILSSTNKNGFLAQGSTGVNVLNTQDSSNLSVIGLYNSSGSALAVELAKDDATLYVAVGSAGVEIVDVGTNLIFPTRLSLYNTPGSAVDIALDANGTKLYIADTVMGVLVLDVSDKVHPRIIEAYNSQGSTNSITLPHSGKKIFVSDGGNGLLILE
jgi:hypothetical protein